MDRQSAARHAERRGCERPRFYGGMVVGNAMAVKVKGCGQTNISLTLYHVGASGKVRPVSSGFEHLPCGQRPSTFDFHTFGILLCKECADRLGFPTYPKEEIWLH